MMIFLPTMELLPTTPSLPFPHTPSPSSAAAAAASTPDCVCWSSLTPLKAPRSCMFLSKRDNLVLKSSFTSNLICKEKIGMTMLNNEDPPPMSKHDPQLPPWVIPAIPEEFSVEPRSSVKPSSKERRVSLSDTKLHFLDEKDEEKLSERILNLSRCNKVRSALELYASMDASELQPTAHACNSLLSCLLRNGLVDEALKVFETVRKKEMATGHTYSLILKAIAGAQGCESALELFTTLEGEVTSKKNFDAIVYNTMIAICGKANKWVDTERMWRKLKENSLDGTMITYCLLVSSFVQCGQTELALDAYHEMINKGLEPSEDVMKAIIASCTKEGNWAVALNVFRKMLDNGMKPNVIAYNAMINCLGKAGEDELAFRIYELMKSSGHAPDAYTWSALLSALYRSKRYADALQLFESIKIEQGSQLNAHLYNTALMSCQRLSLWEYSLQLLWQMEKSEMLVSTVSYNHVICTCEAARKPKVALQVYQHMIHQKCAPDTFTYLSLIRACVWGSLWGEVEKLLEGVAPDASLYNALIHGFSLRGKITLAKKLYTKMRSIGLKPDGKTRALMLQQLSDDGVGRHSRLAKCLYISSGYEGGKQLSKCPYSQFSAAKNSWALSNKVAGNLRCNMKLEEVPEARKLCFSAHSSHVFVPLLSLWIFTLLPLMPLPGTPPFPNTTLVLRFSLRGISPWGFLPSEAG